MSRTSDLTALDIIAAVVAGFAAIALAFFPLVASSFARVFRDLGGELPLWTRMVLVPWQPVIALVTVGTIVHALRARPPLRARRVMFAIAFAIAFFTFTACVVALYLPIFAIAGSIKAD